MRNCQKQGSATGACNSASFVGGEVVGKGLRRVVEVNERVADGIAKRVVNRTAALVPDGAFVEGGGRGRGGA